MLISLQQLVGGQHHDDQLAGLQVGGNSVQHWGRPPPTGRTGSKHHTLTLNPEP